MEFKRNKKLFDYIEKHKLFSLNLFSLLASLLMWLGFVFLSPITNEVVYYIFKDSTPIPPHYNLAMIIPSILSGYVIIFVLYYLQKNIK